MIISPTEVLAGVAEGAFLSGLGDRDMSDPEGAGFDLRIGRLHSLHGAGSLGVVPRQTPAPIEIEAIDGFFTLAPRTYYLATTFETFRTPPDVAALIVARSTLYRSGVVMSGGLVAPGYEGAVTVGLHNARDEEFRIEPMARIVHAVFLAMTSPGREYRGQWQGGRVAAPVAEEQL